MFFSCSPYYSLSSWVDGKLPEWRLESHWWLSCHFVVFTKCHPGERAAKRIMMLLRLHSQIANAILPGDFWKREIQYTARFIIRIWEFISDAMTLTKCVSWIHESCTFGFSLSQSVLIFYETDEALDHRQPHPLCNATNLNEDYT